MNKNLEFFMFKELDRSMGKHGLIGFMELDKTMPLDRYKDRIGEMLVEHFDFEGIYVKSFTDVQSKEPIDLSDFEPYWEFTIGVKGHEDGDDTTTIQIHRINQY